MKKYILSFGVLALLLAAFFLVFISLSNAAITSGSVTGASAGDLVAGAVAADYNTSFLSGSSTLATTISVTFPSGYIVTEGAIATSSIQAGILGTGSLGSILVSTSTEVAVSGVSGASSTRIITLTIPGTNLAAGTTTFRILTGVTNPTTSGTTGTFSLSTSVSGETQTGIAGVLITPAALSDLRCEPSGQAGGMWLRWTVPVGIITTGAGYEAKYQQGNSITYGSATTYSQTWLRQDPGAADQQLVTGLNPNTQYTFAMKANGNDSSLSPESNAATCYAPGSPSRPTDMTAPASRVVFPGYDSNITESSKVLIKGTARDSGGSSVQYVEVSVDAGVSWYPAKITAEVDADYLWEFEWVAGLAGSYTIKTRSADWVGNVETPGDGIKVNVVKTAAVSPSPSPSPIPTPTPVISKPIAEMTPQERETAISSLRVQLESLLRQLITLLQAKIQELLLGR